MEMTLEGLIESAIRFPMLSDWPFDVKAWSNAFSVMMESPKVTSRIVSGSPRLSAAWKSVRWRMYPPRAKIGTTTRNPKTIGRCVCGTRTTATYPAITAKSPWARLMIPITPKSSDKPQAKRA